MKNQKMMKQKMTPRRWGRCPNNLACLGVALCRLRICALMRCVDAQDRPPLPSVSSIVSSTVPEVADEVADEV